MGVPDPKSGGFLPITSGPPNTGGYLPISNGMPNPGM
jgi:hypothetical protein